MLPPLLPHMDIVRNTVPVKPVISAVYSITYASPRSLNFLNMRASSIEPENIMVKYAKSINPKIPIWLKIHMAIKNIKNCLKIRSLFLIIEFVSLI